MSGHYDDAGMLEAASYIAEIERLKSENVALKSAALDVLMKQPRELLAPAEFHEALVSLRWVLEGRRVDGQQ